MTHTYVARRGNVPEAMAWMVGLSILLAWLPLLGGLIAGFVGGRKAGTVPAAIVAVIAPGILLFLISVFLGTLFGWIPLIGQLVMAVVGLGMWAVSFLNVVPLLIGAVLGAATR